MSSLINSAMSGLSAAQAALNTASNNIASYNVAGYTRQTTVLTSSNSTLTGSGYVGNGVTVTGVQREYDAFITNQLRAAQNQNSGLTTRYEQMSKIDDVLSDTTNSLSSSLQSFFSSMQTLVSNASDPSSRQALLGKADGLVNQFKVADQYLRDQDKQVNLSIATSVDQINNYSKQIANLNQQISKLTAVGAGSSPNDLLDQRDQLVSELNKVVGVEVSTQDGSYNVSMGNGITLVQGKEARQLAAVPSSADPARTTLAYVDKIAGNVEIPEKQVTTGSLGGLLSFRTQDLDQARNTLGQLALSFADSFNQQHVKGFDADGDAGEKFFNIGGPSATSNSKNSGDATLTAAVTNSSAVQATDYKVAFDGTQWNVTRLSNNTTIAVTPDTTDGTLNFDGLKVSINNGSTGAKKDDSFTIRPVSNAIVNMSVAVTDESKIAMAGAAGNGASDNRNGQDLLKLQSAKVVGGNKTFNDSYATLVSDVGNKTSTLKTSSATQTNVVTQLSNQQQSISGVNLDEEYGNLQRFQQYYLANAQVLKTASSLFDALLAIR
ncbi:MULTISPECIES: flagellar hook-associated protein FlgK [Kosakonia]|jgi:flagellar hook-associated protein 1 FlgK|uniref:flagellar hook-associated protein FlgK n=1 Tax=Kosakonia TaxID=1330547 RepID=UPI000FECAE3A|nr:MULTISPECIES: flagellar hook-associated protein FlgK [Kosakonia]MDT3411717.1 flagellar hook-associated protein 1 FlgK [Atlantibacter sp. SORGH_AS_0304]MBK0081772.1 flagellar hook-associated protein FlgK [Kosakonia sp. S57]MBK0088609.1 flagellar hook-associated protein FlgK [Kosakonia sp. S58]QAR46723.1 flagellar hook-associated protein FlgK [Kosakonia cowanii]WKW40875.1 flagellar hook-associated protein FlgK [Kosakonia cowanii]